ncbi:uncharacterized protein LOC132203410 [Neocloeon triangulifer]|uniref:uncharacterized protein LOC132203410 n=1 Tax=Neocloeon triangulifer TaxID=2078957 RepID=UPI00286F4C6C|nr:uncharacterized protein LOC132203410 [Neocloeon triangulifer]
METKLVIAALAFLAIPVVVSEFVTIGGEQFYAEYAYLTRDESMAACNQRNMTLLTFDKPGKYDAVLNWTVFQGYHSQVFWTGAVRPENAKKWIWEPSGAQISQFHWGLLEPTEDHNKNTICIYFWPYFGGWFDEPCDNSSSTALLCEFVQN